MHFGSHDKECQSIKDALKEPIIYNVAKPTTNPTFIQFTTGGVNRTAVRFDTGIRLLDPNHSSLGFTGRNGEDADYERLTARLKTSYGIANFTLESLMHNMFVIPVHFNMEHKNIVANCKHMLEYNGGTVAIHPRVNKLNSALRTAVENGEGYMDKEATSHDDLFDSFRLSLMFWS